MSNIDFKTVIPAVQAGDKAARDKLMAAFYGWSVNKAQSVVHDTELSKNVAVDFWTWLYTGDGVLEYNPAKGAFYPWMENQIWYRAMEAVRQKSKEPQVMYYSEVNDPDSFDPTTKLGALEDLETITDKLQGMQRDVFWLLLEGNTPQSIAAACGLSEKRTRNLIGEVRKVIRAQLGEKS